MEIRGINNGSFFVGRATSVHNTGGSKREQTDPQKSTPTGAPTADGGANPQEPEVKRISSKLSQISELTALSPQEKAIVMELKKRDTEVRIHEQAHMAAAGRYARGGPTYKYQRGPDNHQYAVGGEVQMDMSPIPGSPEATIQKMQTIKRAALAPATPSSQDHKVAAAAETKASQARRELLKQLNAAATNSDGSNVQVRGSLIDTVV